MRAGFFMRVLAISGVVVGHSSSHLENKLELALGRVGILAEDFPEGFFCWLVSWLV